MRYIRTHGTQNRATREDFFNCTCAHFLRNSTGPIILGGDFNSVVNEKDATGGTPRSEMTSRLMTALELVDVWRQLHRNETNLTFIRGSSGSRLDRFLVSRSLQDWLRNVSHTVTCFSDHKAVIMRMVLPETGRPLSKGIWRLNARILDQKVGIFS